MCSRLFAGVMFGVCLLFACERANAQLNEHRFEVGGLWTAISLSDFDARTLLGTGDRTVAGAGGRFAYNFTPLVAVEGEANFFPESHLLNEEFAQKVQGFVGIKAGVRNKRVGVFAKARPGVMWFGEFPTRGSCSATTFGTRCTVGHETDFALDVGGVFEFYPAKRLIFRADVGDTIIRYPNRVVGQILVPAATKNNLQLSFGVGWRF